ncbi:MAG: hypothetical protein JKY37_03250, partial [Nannocystaceae bacterium]|nr:hypothetical protein [Nannocystaceae bacterium]
MPAADELPLAEVLQALSSTPAAEPQLRAALATTAARWHLLRGESSDALRQLAHALEMVPDLRPAMRLLYRVYLDRGDVRSAVMYLDQEIRATRHPREAAALYRERGRLVEEHFHDLSAAQQCYQAALKATPRDLAVLRAVERVSLARGDIFWLIANLETQLDVLQDEAAAAGVLHDLALLEARHKGDLALAGDMLLAALERFPQHLGLATDLFRVAEVSGDAELMLRALEVEAEARPVAGRAMPLARASVALREHRERAAALELLRAAALAQPANASLWRSLEELASAAGRWDVAMEACVGQLKAVGESEEAPARAELFYRIGRLALFRLDRPVDGLAAMRKALRLLPGHVPAIEDTGRFLNANGMWAQLLELVKLEISSAAGAGLTSEEIALAQLRAGRIMEERLDELEGARECYQLAVAAHPSYRPARDRLERLLHQLGDAEALRQLYAEELERAETPERRAFLLSLLGQLHARDEDPTTAIKYLAARLSTDEKHLPSIQLLARLLSRAERNEDLLKVTEQEISLTQSTGRRAKLVHRAGEIALVLGQTDKAREFFERALESVDDHLPSLDSLGDLLRTSEDWRGLVALLRKKLLYANDRARQVGLQLEIANLLATRLDEPVEALAELSQLLKRWPRHLPALHAAERLAASLEEPRTLLSLLEQHIAALSGPRTRALLLHRAARVRSKIGDDDGAIRDLVRALELWPQLGVARARLLRLYEKLGRNRELQAFAEAGLTSERGSDDRRAMALQLAELSPKPVVAIQYLGAVAEARPDDYVTQIRLARACRQAGRPSREAGALTAAATVFALERPPEDPALIALRYRAARADEAAGNLDRADAAYEAIVAVKRDHPLALRARARIKERRAAAGLARSVDELRTAATSASSTAERAAYLTIAADLHERMRLDTDALACLDDALAACPAYLPALHARARILENVGNPSAEIAAIDTLHDLATRLHSPQHRSAVLCRAGTLALARVERGHKNGRAWAMFVEALRADPSNDRAFRGLRRTHARHGSEGAPPVAEVLEARLTDMRERKILRGSGLRDIARLGGDLEGPLLSAKLLEHGLSVEPDDPGLRVDLAQAYARLKRWGDCVEQLEAALAAEPTPERSAALHYFAGDAYAAAQQPGDAALHYIAAGRGGFHPLHALVAADRLAAETDNLPLRVEALELLVDIGSGPERAAGLRSLAELHRGPLGQPEVAIERMRELLLLRPTDIDVVLELVRLLEAMDRKDEATAALLAGVAHNRAWLRSVGLSSATGAVADAAPVLSLLRLFDAMGETDGMYLAACATEVVAPEQVPPQHAPDALVGEPWPLPTAQDGRPFDGLVGDLPGGTGLDLLREGVFYLGSIPGAEPPAVDVTSRRSLPQNSAVVMVARALGNAMGVNEPLVFVDPRAEDGVVAFVAPTPCLVVGRRINGAPFGAAARDQLGRALLRLSTGGDALHRGTTPGQLLAILVALCRGTGVMCPTAPGVELDEAFVTQVAETLPAPGSLSGLREVADIFASRLNTFDPVLLLEALRIAEDRAGAVCAADPRPSLCFSSKPSELSGLFQPSGNTKGTYS